MAVTATASLIPILRINKWKSDKDIIEFCEHIISHSERYVPQRVFEAKELKNSLLNKYKKQFKTK